MTVACRQEGFSYTWFLLLPVHQTFPPSCQCLSDLSRSSARQPPFLSQSSVPAQAALKVVAAEDIRAPGTISTKEQLHNRRGGLGEKPLLSTTFLDSPGKIMELSNGQFLQKRCQGCKRAPDFLHLAAQEYPSVKQQEWGKKCKFYF